MRLFVAIQFSEPVKKSLIGLMHDLKERGVKGNYTPAQNLHLTMCFIGETNERAKIEEALLSVSYKPFKLALSDTGSFGDIFWVGIKGGQAINRLSADIRNALTEAGISFDTKKFVPHITLIRKAAGNMSRINVPKADMMVSRISLMKSENVKGKMVYTEIFHF